MYTSKASMERWNELTKATKNMLRNGNQNSMSKATMSNPGKGEKTSQEKPQEKLKIEVALALPINQATSRQTEEFTPTDLQQAVIWSEVLGKPVSKRKERRYYGN